MAIYYPAGRPCWVSGTTNRVFNRKEGVYIVLSIAAIAEARRHNFARPWDVFTH